MPFLGEFYRSGGRLTIGLEPELGNAVHIGPAGPLLYGSLPWWVVSQGWCKIGEKA